MITYYLKNKLRVIGLYALQIFLFCIPLGVLMIVYRETFFTKSTAAGLTGLGILGVIVYMLSIKQIIGKLPKIVYFLFLFILFVAMDSLAAFLKQIGTAMLIGACISLPISPIIHVYKVDGETDITERSKIRFKQRQEAEKKKAIKKLKSIVEVEVE